MGGDFKLFTELLVVQLLGFDGDLLGFI